MLDDFLVRAGIAVLGIACIAGPLGCLIVWRRMAYFGDATAHASILGVALSLTFSISIFVGVLAVALVAATLVATLTGRTYASDTLLGVIAHGALAIGIVAISFLPNVRVDISAYLLGDILTVSKPDLGVIAFGVVAVFALLYWRWSALLISTTHRELAHASGINPAREQLILNLCVAIAIAVSIQIVGALLISAFMIIPAATARAFTRSPETMVIASTLIAAASGLAGLTASVRLDTPTGPTIVALAALFFALAALYAWLRPAP